jgi:O-antigen ligase
MDATLRRTETRDVVIDPQIIIKFAIWMALFLVGLANLPASVRYFRSIPNFAIVTYFLMALLSALYSPFPKYTIGCAAGYLFTFVFMAAVVARLDFKSLLTTALLSLAAHVALSLVLLAIDPNLALWTNWSGSDRRLTGMLGHPFRLADVAALFALSAWIMWRLNWLSMPALMLAFAMGVPALVLTNERTAIAAFMLSLLAFGQERKASIITLVGILAAGLIALFGVPDLLVNLASSVSRGDNADQGLSLTGRTHIWAISLDAFAHQPILGYGFASTRVLFATQWFDAFGRDQPPPHAHNVVIQSLFTMGIVGTFVLLVAMIGQLTFALRNRDAPINAFICYAFFSGLMNASPVGMTPNVMTIFWMAAFLLAAPAARFRTDAAAIFGARNMSAPPIY